MGPNNIVRDLIPLPSAHGKLVMPTKINKRIDPKAMNEYQRGRVISPRNNVIAKLMETPFLTIEGVSSINRFPNIVT